MSVSKRIGEILNETNLPSTKLGSMLGTSHTTIMRLKKGEGENVSTELLSNFVKKFPDISPDWILNGIGDKTRVNYSGKLIDKGIEKPLDPDISKLIVNMYDVNASLHEQLQTQADIIRRSLIST